MGDVRLCILEHTLDIYLPPERILDVMVQAMSHALPGKLSVLCDVLGMARSCPRARKARL